MTKRLFAPVVEITGLSVPLDQFAEALQCEVALRVKTWAVDDPTPEQFPVKDMVTWPMDAETFIDRGVALLQHLHDICENGKADKGNDFLDMYNLAYRGYEHLPRPAQTIEAALYASDDGGQSWVDVRHSGWRR